MNPRTTPLPPVDLTDPIWTLEHLAQALRLGERATRTLVAGAGFPSPFRLTSSRTARLYWMRQDLLDHFASPRGRMPVPEAPLEQPAPTLPTSRFGPSEETAALAELATLPVTGWGER